MTNDTRKAAKTTTQARGESGAKEGTAVPTDEGGAEVRFVGMTRNHTQEWATMPPVPARSRTQKLVRSEFQVVWLNNETIQPASFDDEYPVSPQYCRFTAKQVHAPETVLHVTEKH